MTPVNGPAEVAAVARRTGHHFSKQVVDSIELLAGLGVCDDGHAGSTVQHRSRVRRDPSQPNLRQVHLLHAELFDELHELGYDVRPGDLGENITTRGLDILALPRGAVLRIAESAIEVTGLRNPCYQIDQFRRGVLSAVLQKRDDASVVRKAGIMGVVTRAGAVTAGAAIRVELPPEPHCALEPV